MKPSDQILAFAGAQVINYPNDTMLAEIGIVANGFVLGVFSPKYEPMYGVRLHL